MFALYYVEKGPPKKKEKTPQPPKGEPPKGAHPGRAVAKKQRAESPSPSHASGSMGPRHGPLAVGAVAASNAQWNRQSLKEIAASLKSAHKAIGHFARLCSAHATFPEEAHTVAGANAQVGVPNALAP